MGLSYAFPALRGKQAGKEYYVVMCPMRLIPKIFLFDEEEIPADFGYNQSLIEIGFWISQFTS